MQTTLRSVGELHYPVDASPDTITIWEAGHYYESKGPTEWSRVGWKILNDLASPHESRMLFIDDVHSIAELHPQERDLETVSFDPDPSPNYIVTESGVLKDAYIALERLQALTRRKRARRSGSKRVWRCSGHVLTKADNKPMCLFYDLGLAELKRSLGYTRTVTILPESYELEQRRLRQIVRKAIPDLTMDVILYRLDGSWRWL